MDVASNQPTILGIDDPAVERLAVASADLSLALDRDGKIVNLWRGADLEKHPGWDSLLGRHWSETVLEDSRHKVQKLVDSAFGDEAGRSREINQHVEGLGPVPLRFRGARIGEEHVVAFGRDIRPVADMQQRMVAAQQMMDREFRRLRQADTRYRVLFHVSAEGTLVVDRNGPTVVEANPAATEMLGDSAQALRGRPLRDLFDPTSRDQLNALLGAAEAGAQSQVKLYPADDTSLALMAEAAVFRQNGSVYLLLRLWRPTVEAIGSARHQRLMRVLESIPEGFVVTSPQGEILAANSGFCELVQRPDETHVRGRSLERWVGRPGVDFNIVAANLREQGVVRDFATVIRSEFGLTQEAMLTAVNVTKGRVPCFGFTIRTTTSRITERRFLPQSKDHLRSLVGRVSLKEIVRDSTDLIERLCIEAALDVSSNNRAAAAQLLGLSRQSLYSKLRRHGIADGESYS